jgi:hypothetical protein
VSADGNRAVVRRYYEGCWNDDDLAAMDEVAAPEVLAHFEMGKDMRITPVLPQNFVLPSL